MDWLRNNTFINRQQVRALPSTEEECDPTACYDSFKQHWQQALKIIKRNQQMPSHDDVLGVVNHLEQMVSLLLYDVKKIDQITLPISNTSRCLEYLISENILDKLYEWGIRTGKYANAVRVEQLKFYEMLISQSRHLLLVHEPFLRPLLKILNSYLREVLHKEVEKRLVTLLYQLCIVLMQNIDLVDLFFPRTKGIPKFIIVELLISFVHRDDNIGMQARDALLLCMSLSKKNNKVKQYIAENSAFCQLLVTGLGGLYSVLPLVLIDITVPDWHRITPDDVNDIKSLSLFVTSLEFCNLVSQVAHPVISKQLQDFMYRGFLIPVFGAALLQTLIDEQIAVTAYLEIMLRTVTNPGLLYPCLMFVLKKEYDDQLVFDILMNRLSSQNSQLCLVSLALFETLVDLNCEDVMLELIFHHLQPCLHLMISQRRILLPLDPHCQSFEKFLNLAPSVCELTNLTCIQQSQSNVHWNHYGGHSSLYGNYHAYLCDARNKINACQVGCSMWTHLYTGCENILPDNTEETSTSLTSVGESSGYESLKIKLEENTSSNITTSTVIPVWQISMSDATKTTNLNGQTTEAGVDHFNNSGTAGPFLTILLEKLKNMLSNSFYINLHLTGIISRLAVYPQPLLRTYLLDHSLVLQPNVPSLFQIVGSLKQKIDEFMNKQPEKLALIHQARSFLLERETRLVNARKSALALDSSMNSAASTTAGISSSSSWSSSNIDNDATAQPFQRNAPKRRSLTQSLSNFSSIFSRRPSTAEAASMQLLAQNQETSTKHYVLYPKFSDAQHVAVCAVLLDEWVKELAALAQEHTISQLAALFK